MSMILCIRAKCVDGMHVVRAHGWRQYHTCCHRNRMCWRATIKIILKGPPKLNSVKFYWIKYIKGYFIIYNQVLQRRYREQFHIPLARNCSATTKITDDRKAIYLNGNSLGCQVGFFECFHPWFLLNIIMPNKSTICKKSLSYIV